MQSIEEYEGTNIVYGLGNFSFGGTSWSGDFDAMIYTVSITVSKSGAIEATDYAVVPVLISSEWWTGMNNYQPVIAEGDEKARIEQKLQDLSPTLTIKYRP
jgi:poly-gamma-glutamate synthesis protein (capsule biosynthesis protein)